MPSSLGTLSDKPVWLTCCPGWRAMAGPGLLARKPTATVQTGRALKPGLAAAAGAASSQLLGPAGEVQGCHGGSWQAGGDGRGRGQVGGGVLRVRWMGIGLQGVAQSPRATPASRPAARSAWCAR